VYDFRLDADPTNWMDGGSWEGTMSDLLWDEDGEMYRCSPRPAAWHPPNKMTGRHSHDSLLSLKRLVICSEQCECLKVTLLTHTHSAATKSGFNAMCCSCSTQAVLLSASWKIWLCCQALLLQNLQLMLVLNSFSSLCHPCHSDRQPTTCTIMTALCVGCFCTQT